MISVLVPTFNERGNIAECLQSVCWSDDIWIVDSRSTDGTPEIASRLGAHVIQFNWDRKFPKKKNWALEQLKWKYDWVLILDADERVTKELAAEMKRAVESPRVDGYYVNRRFMFLGRWLRHCGYYPSWNLRLFRHRLGRFENLHPGDTGSGDNEVHEHLSLAGSTSCLQHELLHLAYPDIFTWLEKHNRYSNWEAEIEVRGNQSACGATLCESLVQRRRLRTLSRCLPFRATLRFLYSYIFKRGFLDGYHGYLFCRLLATYEMLNVFKAYELRGKIRSGD